MISYIKIQMFFVKKSPEGRNFFGMFLEQKSPEGRKFLHIAKSKKKALVRGPNALLRTPDFGIDVIFRDRILGVDEKKVLENFSMFLF